MATRSSKASLLRQMEEQFPERWEVTNLDIRKEGGRVLGTIKIHCLEDDKMFLSDFTATLDGEGKMTQFTLDGVNVGKFVGKLHSS